MLVRIADQETPSTEQAPSADTGAKKSHKGGKKTPAAAAPAAPVAGAGAPAAAGAGKKTPTTLPTGTAAAKVPTKQAPATPAAAAAGVVKKGPATPPATAPAAATALPPGVPAGATKVPGSGGNAPSYLVPTANGTQTYIMDPRTGQYYNVTAASAQPGQ